MSTEENKAIARRWNDEIYDKRSLAAIDELFATNFVWHYAPPGVAPDREGYKQENVTNLGASFGDVHCTIEDMVAEGDKVAVRWSWRGTHKGEYMGIAPTGKEMTITGISILRIVGSKIVEEWGEADNLGFMQQLGAKVG
jgi:predicted ester cyclase